MDYFRVGKVCLLLMIIAAALPSGWAQAPQGSDQGEGSAGPAPVVSEDFFTKGSGQGESVSPESLMKRSSDLKPVRASGSVARPQSLGTSVAQAQESAGTAVQETQTAEAQQPEVAQETPEPVATEIGPQAVPEETAATAQESQAVSESQVEPEVAETPKAFPVTQEVITPDMIPQENLTAVPNQDNVTPGTPAEIVNVTPENITPPENVTPENLTAEVAATENVTEEGPVEEEAEEVEVGTDRIWREGINPDTYTWTPMTFSGFFYDFDDKVGTETLTVSLTGRTIDSGNLKYSTKVQGVDYEFGDWGKYDVIGFMAEKYFAGYNGTSPDVVDEEISLINEGQLRRVLTDSDEENTITSGSVLALDEGYELRIKEIDVNGNKVFLSLAKDGEEIDSKVVSPDGTATSTYKYEVDIEGKDTPIIMAHIDNVFRGTETDLVTVDGLFQLSDTFASVEEGDKYGEMEVIGLDNGVEMENEDSISLRRDRTVDLFGNVGFEVADSDVLRFAPVVSRTGTYEVRGTVIDPSEVDEFNWNPYNFEGFYYDIDDDIGTENLTVRITGTSRIAEGDLIYETNPQPVTFEFDRWGKYDVIGFMADKYFAGYNDDTEFTDPVSIINEGQLRKILLDSDDDRTISTGSVLPLEEGYELRINQVDVNGNKVFLSLAKDGEEVDSKVVTPSSDPADPAANYLYEIDIDSEENVPIIAAHVQSVFRGTEADLATIDGLFQVSDSAQSVEEGEVHGKMKVEGLSDEGVRMENEDSISLGQGKLVEIMDNLKFRVADNPDRNFAPVSEKATGGKPISINFSEAVVGLPVKITVRTDSTPLSAAQVFVAGSNLSLIH
ncbi:MAG: S-layer protein domain-containing protein, partial [Methanotrichaceae archaeon]|nr:S-layer protein domain-containing protein [Methanotrichaceae archaeon]